MPTLLRHGIGSNRKNKNGGNPMLGARRFLSGQPDYLILKSGALPSRCAMWQAPQAVPKVF